MKDLCFTGKNVTIGFVQITADNMLMVERKSLTGLIGKQP